MSIQCKTSDNRNDFDLWLFQHSEASRTYWRVEKTRCSRTWAVECNSCKIKPHRTRLSILYGFLHVGVREKLKKMSGRVHSDCLFGGDEVGLKMGGSKS